MLIIPGTNSCQFIDKIISKTVCFIGEARIFAARMHSIYTSQLADDHFSHRPQHTGYPPKLTLYLPFAPLPAQ